MVDKMEQLKLELKMLEQNDSSVTSIWKKKCLDLFEVCQSMKKENEDLRNRCFELVNQGIYLAESLEKKQPDISTHNSFSNYGGLPEISTRHPSSLKLIKPKPTVDAPKAHTGPVMSNNSSSPQLQDQRPKTRELS
jgi:hypothetical protein